MRPLNVEAIPVVSASEICGQLGVDIESPEYDIQVDGWSCGDTKYTLVGNIEYLDMLLRVISQTMHQGGISLRHRKYFTETYWNIVPMNAYVNLER
jgi:hypothetical protein